MTESMEHHLRHDIEAFEQSMAEEPYLGYGISKR